MYATLAKHYGFKPWDVRRLTLPQVEAYLRRLPDTLQAEASVTAQAQSAMMSALFGGR